MYIYSITNKIDNKTYIGKCERPIDKSKTYFGSGKYIKRAIQKHNIENFNKEIIEECIDSTELGKREIYWIDKLNTTVPYGYNITTGGEGGNGGMKGETNPFYGKTHTEYTKKLLSSIFKNRIVVTDGNGNNFSVLNTDERFLSGELVHVCKGKKHTDEAKEKMSESHKANPVRYWLGKKRSKESIEKAVSKHRGYKHTEEYKEKMSGENNQFYGKTHTNESKLKISESHKKRTPEQRLERYKRFYITKCGKEPTQETLDKQYNKYLKQ